VAGVYKPLDEACTAGPPLTWPSTPAADGGAPLGGASTNAAETRVDVRALVECCKKLVIVGGSATRRLVRLVCS
jgi:hypothetical protein